MLIPPVTGARRRKARTLMGNAVWRVVDAALDASAPLVGLGAAAGIDAGYVNAMERAGETVAIVGAQIVEIPYEIFTKGGVFLDNKFLKYGLATLGDVASNLAREPGKTLTALAAGYLAAKALAKVSSYYRIRWRGRSPATLRAVPR
jgi:hypothetical protein